MHNFHATNSLKGILYSVRGGKVPWPSGVASGAYSFYARDTLHAVGVLRCKEVQYTGGSKFRGRGSGIPISVCGESFVGSNTWSTYRTPP